MKEKGRAGWIIGIIIASVVCLFMFILFISALSEVNSGSNNPTMSVDEMGAHCYRASELFCAGVYYTDKALSADPEQMSYKEWIGYVDKAEEYWDALDYELDLIEGYADTEGFEDAFEDTEVKDSFAQRISNVLFPTAYAIDTEDIMRAYNGAEAGKELQAVADYLGKDKKYAESALKVARGEIDSQKWNNVADTMQTLESAARITKTAAQTTALVLGAPSATGVLGGAALVVNGASLIWQAADDACFIFMGNDYDSSEFVANLGKVSDFVAPIAFAGSMLTMDFTGKKIDAVLSSYTFADTMRGMLLDGKIAGIQLNGSNGDVVSLTKNELLAYQQAKKDGQSLPGEIEALLKTLENKEDEPVDLPEFKVKADKSLVMVEEWVTFTVEDTQPEYTYIWEYGGNKNPQDTASFNYMYQVAGTFTMYVTILDKDGEAIGRGSCTVDVEEMTNTETATYQNDYVLYASDTHVEVGEIVNFYVEPWMEGMRYTWVIDGSIYEGVDINYTYSSVGTDTVEVQVIREDEIVFDDTISITITAPTYTATPSVTWAPTEPPEVEALPTVEGMYIRTIPFENPDNHGGKDGYDEIYEFFADGTFTHYTRGFMSYSKRYDIDEAQRWGGEYTVVKMNNGEWPYEIVFARGGGVAIFSSDLSGNNVISLKNGLFNK